MTFRFNVRVLPLADFAIVQILTVNPFEGVRFAAFSLCFSVCSMVTWFWVLDVFC